MNLQENIKRILREEIQFSTEFKRRIGGFVHYVWNNFATQYPCDSETFEDFMQVLYMEIEQVVDEGDAEDGPVSNWLTYEEGVEYVKKYMLNDLKQFYDEECS